MNLSSLFIVCSHGRRSAHGHELLSKAMWWCPGGRPATLEDLGGIKLWWCEYHYETSDDTYTGTEQCEKLHPGMKCGWHLLIPLPQMVAGESL